MATGLAHEIHNPLAAIRMHAQLIESSRQTANSPPPRASRCRCCSARPRRSRDWCSSGCFSRARSRRRPRPRISANSSAGVVRAARSAGRARRRRRSSTKCRAGLRARGRCAPHLAGHRQRRPQRHPGHARRRHADHPRRPRPTACELVFHDTGPGFSAEALAHHADLFFSEKEGGMGIGLSVTAEILKAHGGALLVANAPGRWRGRHLRLPCWPSGASPPHPATRNPNWHESHPHHRRRTRRRRRARQPSASGSATRRGSAPAASAGSRNSPAASSRSPSSTSACPT